MIVNPQLFNYRLITGSLVVGIAVISIFSFTNNQSIEAKQQLLEQENKIINIELSNMIKRYEDVSLKNNQMTSQLDQANLETQKALKEVRELQDQLSVIPKIEHQVSVLQSKNKELNFAVNSVNLKNTELESENLKTHNELQNQITVNNSLFEENKALKENLKKASIITANSLKAIAFNKVLGKTLVTSKATKTNSIEVSFTLGQNVFAEAGNKDIYIQILTPSNNVFADKGAINFGESSLIYSIKKIIPYNNTDLDVSISVNAEEDDKPLIEGTYYISVFNKDHKLGSTLLQLD